MDGDDLAVLLAGCYARGDGSGARFSARDKDRLIRERRERAAEIFLFALAADDDYARDFGQGGELLRAHERHGLFAQERQSLVESQPGAFAAPGAGENGVNFHLSPRKEKKPLPCARSR